MTGAGFDAARWSREIADATAALVRDAEGWGERDMREASLLPGWSRGHVLTHLARNADGGARLLAWARTGIPRVEYPGRAARAAAIEAGAGRDARTLVADLRAAAGRFAAAYERVPASGWRRTVRWTIGGGHPASRIADARLCEVLVHHVDLRAGRTPDGWPPAFVTRELGRVVRSFASRPDAPRLDLHATDTGRRYTTAAPEAPRGPDPATGSTALPRTAATAARGARGLRLHEPRPGHPRTVSGAESELLAWLMGRRDGAGLPEVPFLY